MAESLNEIKKKYIGLAQKKNQLLTEIAVLKTKSDSSHELAEKEYELASVEAELTALKAQLNLITLNKGSESPRGNVDYGFVNENGEVNIGSIISIVFFLIGLFLSFLVWSVGFVLLIISAYVSNKYASGFIRLILVRIVFLTLFVIIGRLNIFPANKLISAVGVTITSMAIILSLPVKRQVEDEEEGDEEEDDGGD